MFDRIAAKYDLLNHLLSANRDKTWRHEVAERLLSRDNQHVLDLACGTGDQLLALLDSGKVKHGVGVDLAEKMLAIGHAKIARKGLEKTLSMQRADAEALPFENGSFDAVTISFGIRNMTDVSRTLGEMYRVLNTGGRAIVLEFSLPGCSLVRGIYLLYLRRVLPRLGKMISGDRSAYCYLNQTIETFPCGDAFCRLMERAGFRDVRAAQLTLGVVSVYQGDK